MSVPEDWGITRTEFGLQFYPHKVKGEGFYIACFKKKKGEGALPKIRKLKSCPFQKLKPLAKNQLAELGHWIENPELFSFFLNPNNQIHAILKSQVPDCQILDSTLRKKSFGIEIGSFKGQEFIPSHALALSTIIKPNLPSIEMEKDKALRFLKKEAIEPGNMEKGWVLARNRGHNLGWLKVLKNRTNNYLPKEYRIRMDLE